MATTKEFPSGFAAVGRSRKMRMSANFKAIKGTIACIALAGGQRGHMVGGALAADLLVVGRYGETVDNTGGAIGAKTVDVFFHRQFECMSFINDTVAPVTNADIGQMIYMKDNNTVSASATTASPAGVAWWLEDGMVFFEPMAPRTIVIEEA
jgi:hypothetical protein